MDKKNNKTENINEAVEKDYSKYMMIGVFLLLVVILFILWYGKKPDDKTLKEDVNLVESEKQVSVITKTIKEDNNNLEYTLDIEYPEIIGVKNLDIQDKINKKIKGDIEKSIEEFKKNVNEFSVDDIPIEQKSGLWLRYKYYKPLEKVVSILINKSDYYKGAAHPNNNDFTYNFNLDIGDIIELGDLFISGSDYLKDISDYTIRELDVRFGEQGWFKEGALPDEKNYNFFIINKDFITFIFNPYQVGPYAIGVVEINILNKDLAEILKPDWQ